MYGGYGYMEEEQEPIMLEPKDFCIALAHENNLLLSTLKARTEDENAPTRVNQTGQT